MDQFNDNFTTISAADLFLANDLIERGDYDRAVELLETAVAENPTDSTALTELGIAFTEGGEHEKAIKALVRSIQLEEGASEAHEALGCAYYRSGRYEEARRHLERARELSPQDSGVLRNLGIAVDKLGDFDGGLALVEEAVRINAFDYQALYALASFRLRQGALEEALEVLDRIASDNSPVGLRLLALDHIKNLRRYL